MIGQITPLADNRFMFKLAGDNPNDPGLIFGSDERRERTSG